MVSRRRSRKHDLTVRVLPLKIEGGTSFSFGATIQWR